MKMKDHEVDVLAGAFMMVKKEVLDKTGGFDEVFFMYGEDVDLSYRMQKTRAETNGNYKNYYFAGSTHYSLQRRKHQEGKHELCKNVL